MVRRVAVVDRQPEARLVRVAGRRRSPGKPPNRWVSVVEGSAWEYDELTGQYYYHAFLPFQPDLNWRNPEVRDEMLSVAAFWLDKGADGLRLDLVNFLVEDAELRDNPRRLGARPYEWQHHVYDRSRPESVEIARQLRALTDEYPERALMGEVYTDVPEDALEFLGDGSDGLHLSFYLDFTARPWSAEGYRDSVQWLEERLPEGAWPCYYLNNHDLPRTYGRLGGRLNADAKAKLALAMLLTLRGTPIVYYGEEIGMPPSKVPTKRVLDPLGKKFWPLPLHRDGSRTPMHWDSGLNAGFTESEPWLPVDPCYPERNVEAELADESSLLNWYRRLLSLRSGSVALRTGSYRSLDAMPRGVFAYLREAEGQHVLVALNFASRPREIVLPPACDADAPAEPLAWEVLLTTRGADSEGVVGSRRRCRPRARSGHAGCLRGAGPRCAAVAGLERVFMGGDVLPIPRHRGEGAHCRHRRVEDDRRVGANALERCGLERPQGDVDDRFARALHQL